MKQGFWRLTNLKRAKSGITLTASGGRSMAEFPWV